MCSPQVVAVIDAWDLVNIGESFLVSEERSYDMKLSCKRSSNTYENASALPIIFAEISHHGIGANNSSPSLVVL